MKAIFSPHADAVLRHHQYQGHSNDCGPYCVAMIVNSAAPRLVAASTVAREAERLGWRGLLPVVRRVPGWATFPWGMVDVLRDHGLRASWRALSDENQLRAILARGRLPIVALGGWRPRWGHWVVVLAYDPDLGWGLADPGSSDGDMVWMSVQRFSRRWRALGRIVVEVDPVPPRRATA